jgi:hypothetical protein
VEILSSHKRLAVVLLAAALTSTLASARDDEHATEHQVKAAFLYHFLKFVDWPVPPVDRPWQIGVVGSAQFAEVLAETVKGKTVKGRPVTVVPVTNTADARNCHIVFFSSPLKNAPASVTGVLTVGEDARFLAAGGILNFFLEDNKVRFEINAQAARSAGLRMSAQLMQLGSVR